ncbi:MAG TPA: ATP-binding protein [Candidatus Angelobacter sp.]|nr:ATP-binding protein [Candidatus Angelobacter sp.]
MATAKMHFQPQRRRRDNAPSREACLRLLQAERSEDIFPILLEEIVALGHPRAAVLETTSGCAAPAVALNWGRQQLEKLTVALRTEGHPLMAGVDGRRSVVGAKINLHHRLLYVYPMRLSNPSSCPEAGQARRAECLAAQNFRGIKGNRPQDQICSVCTVRGHSAAVVVELRRHHTEADLMALNELIDLTNGYLSRLFKSEHYYNRLRDMEITMAQVGTVMHKMTDSSVMLTDTQHRALIRDKDRVERRMLEIEKFAAAGRLAATIAHEVNNPMEAIKNAVYLLAPAVPESAAPVYNILKAETERVARVVRQMLGLYRETEPSKPVNVNTIIEDTLLLLNRQMERAGVRVETELGTLPDAILAADQIRQVFSNLLLNARDAMPEGGTLRIRTRAVRALDNLRIWVRILIADTGTGIAPEIIGDIFEPFVTTKGEKGTGLGLWIVRGIVHNHEGRISVRSGLGKGTVFQIDLPVTKP